MVVWVTKHWITDGMLTYPIMEPDRSVGLWGATSRRQFGPGGLVSQSITWETVTQWNIGLDFNMVNSRLKGAFDYYQRRTSDILSAGKILPGVLGANEPLENAAESLTKGWEFEISWNDQLPNGIHYNIGFNLSDYQSEVTKFDNIERSLSNSYVGQKQGEIWGYETAGLFQSPDEIADAPIQDKVSGGIQLIPGISVLLIWMVTELSIGVTTLLIILVIKR